MNKLARAWIKEEFNILLRILVHARHARDARPLPRFLRSFTLRGSSVSNFLSHFVNDLRMFCHNMWGDYCQ